MSNSLHTLDHAARSLAESLDLKPCPFDGGHPVPFTSDGWWGVRCTSCQASVNLQADETAAAAVWNRRT